MLKKLTAIERRYDEVCQLLSNSATLSDRAAYQKLSREHAHLHKIVEQGQRCRSILKRLQDDDALLHDPDLDGELEALARDEMKSLREQLEQAEAQLKFLLLPKDPNEEKNVILEIRAGTGGEEAALFAADLFRMYCRYAESHRWRVEILSSSSSATGGFKEVIALVEGPGAFSALKFESGTHRVQRVPETEAQGRIHTSAATVAILPEAEEVEVQINPNDVRVDVFRSSGPGGQSVNTTDSAVRVTHLPTGIVVSCQDEKSQHKNRARAMQVLRARLLDRQQQEMEQERAMVRRVQVGSGDRSERIRTYNYPQNRVTDHRINLTLYQLDRVLEGGLDGIVEELQLADQQERLKVSV
ncbi:MAG: peptide chain release factor 1 [Candidatus Tectomicrobia bacterium]|nr:peptide chain release factor 1 [Candidatus Tectomicrobia bacterium]